jgi:hypothetical protein
MPDTRGTAARITRTLQYTQGSQPKCAAAITAGARTAESRSGQIAILSATNMLARVHPALVICVPDVPVIVPAPFPGGSLAEACERLARAANPDIAATSRDTTPANMLSVGIGADSPPATIHAGAKRWTALTGREPQALTQDPSSLLGLAMSISLACSTLFRIAIDLPTEPTRAVSLWSFTATAHATGPHELGPLDIGSTWMLGAGAVGSALAWWLQYIGVVGPWTIIDGDFVDETNLNRSLGYFASHAGLTGDEPAAKANATAALIAGATPFLGWWNDFIENDPAAPDVLLPIANEHEVRPAIAAYGHPAVLHASTSPSWTAELHRHLIHTDDCIACRLPETAPRFQCATAPTGAHSDDDASSTDAALPFLSGAAGVLLTAALGQLQEGTWTSHNANHWRCWFDHSARPISSSRWRCQDTCTATPPPSVRSAIHRHTRWTALDGTQTHALTRSNDAGGLRVDAGWA